MGLALRRLQAKRGSLIPVGILFGRNQYTDTASCSIMTFVIDVRSARTLTFVQSALRKLGMRIRSRVLFGVISELVYTPGKQEIRSSKSREGV